MKKPLFLSFLLGTSYLHAHPNHRMDLSDHDWREDYEAYLMVNYEIRTSQSGLINSTPKKSRVDTKFMADSLQVFSGALPVPGTNEKITERSSVKKLDLARTFLMDEYKKLGFEVSLQPFGTGTNFIAEKKGLKTPEKVLVLSSHIDSVGNAGANDNGTGTIGLLTVAQELAKKEYGSTIRILGFDREERGLIGSDAYVATILDKKSIIGNINFEMMGHNSRNDGAFHVIDCDQSIFGKKPQPGSEVLSQNVKDSISSLNLDLTVVSTCTGRSDHASFWRAKIPAIVISENFFGGDADPCYHAKCDVFNGRLNFEYMGRILDAVLDTTEKLVK